MYVPQGFEMGDDELRQFLRDAGSGDLITQGPAGLLATLVPFVHDPDPTGAGHGRLRGHLARENPQWKSVDGTQALVILRGPESYISPTWYDAKQEHGRVVPTWNYVTAHVYGQLHVHDDKEFVRAVVHDLTTKHEASRAQPWVVGDAPARYVEGLLRAIVGVELQITRVEAKAKLSQNRPADIDGVIAGLEADGQHQMAEQVQAHRPRA